MAILLSAALCACGGGPGGSGASSIFSGATSIFGSSTTNMSLAPIIGAPPNVAQELTQDLVAAGKDRNLIITPGTALNDYTVRGYLVASDEKKGSKISYIWDVTDSKSVRVTRVTGDEVIPNRSGADPWSGVDSATLRTIAGKTASDLAANVPKGGKGALAAGPDPTTKKAATTVAAPAQNEVTALVPPVSGAPGDGQKSLTAALKGRLLAGGVKIGTSGEKNAYTVRGIVKLTDAGAGKQSIRIDWQVLDPHGKKLGTVSQQNTIPKDSLNGPWGTIADAAAGAAADGIIKLLPKTS